MNRFLLFSINFFKIALIVCFCIEIIVIIGGLIFNLMNPDMKGVSKTDFRQLIIIAAITIVLLFFLIFIKKKYKASITK